MKKGPGGLFAAWAGNAMTYLKRCGAFMKAEFGSDSGVRWGRVSCVAFVGLVGCVLLMLLSKPALDWLRGRFDNVSDRVSALEEKADCMVLHNEDMRMLGKLERDVRVLWESPALQAKILRKHQENLRGRGRNKKAGATAASDTDVLAFSGTVVAEQAVLEFGKRKNKFRIGPIADMAERMRRQNLQDTYWLTGQIKSERARQVVLRGLRKGREAIKKGMAESRSASRELPRFRSQKRAWDTGRSFVGAVVLFLVCASLAAACIGVIAFLLWLYGVSGLAAAVNGWLALGAGIVLAPLGLCLMLGGYLIATAPTIRKYQKQVESYREEGKAASKRFRALAAERGLPPITMIGTVVTKADKADPARRKKAETERRLMTAEGGPLRWVGWLKDYPELDKAHAEEGRAQKASAATGRILGDLSALRDPIKWLLIGCFCWMILKLTMFLRRPARQEAGSCRDMTA